mmetsp:Transcript_106957/g.307629  ORF Transcript_106957/g.307629 Transcript_106957/m.307629 type:complete len:285 (+) Transcript_106957:1064-1918(+)
MLHQPLFGCMELRRRPFPDAQIHATLAQALAKLMAVLGPQPPGLGTLNEHGHQQLFPAGRAINVPQAHVESSARRLFLRLRPAHLALLGVFLEVAIFRILAPTTATARDPIAAAQLRARRRCRSLQTLHRRPGDPMLVGRVEETEGPDGVVNRSEHLWRSAAVVDNQFRRGPSLGYVAYFRERACESLNGMNDMEDEVLVHGLVERGGQALAVKFVRQMNAMVVDEFRHIPRGPDGRDLVAMLVSCAVDIHPQVMQRSWRHFFPASASLLEQPRATGLQRLCNH